jgi:hypothetical protein
MERRSSSPFNGRNNFRDAIARKSGAFAAGDNQTCAHDDHNDSDRGRQFLIVLSRDADMSIANTNIVMMIMREWYEERTNAKYENPYSDQRECLHDVLYDLSARGSGTNVLTRADGSCKTLMAMKRLLKNAIL